MADLVDRLDAMAVRSIARSVDEAAALAERVVVRAERIEAKRQHMRETMPRVAGLVDMFRDAGMEVRVLMAEENGQRVVARGYVDDGKR